MLRVIGSRKLSTFSVIIDDYIPVTFENLELTPSLTYYWTMGDAHRQLLEIGIDADSGEISRFVVAALGSRPTIKHLQLHYEHHIVGIPRIDVSLWPSPEMVLQQWSLHRIESQNPFTVSVTNSTLALQFAPITAVLKEGYIVGNVVFGIDNEDYLSTLEIRDVDQTEMKQILGSID